MFIVIEGPDGSGKSQLATRLAKHLEGIVIHNFKRPKNLEDLHDWDVDLESIGWNQDLISDRSPAISELVYGSVLRGSTVFPQDACYPIWNRFHLVVYCRPPTATIRENLRFFPQLKGVEENIELLTEAYDELMDKVNQYTEVVQFNYLYPEAFKALTDLIAERKVEGS